MKKLIALRAVRHMAKYGMNPKTLQYLMGHSDIAVTLNVYTHVGLEDAEKELQKLPMFFVKTGSVLSVWKSSYSVG